MSRTAGAALMLVAGLLCGSPLVAQGDRASRTLYYYERPEPSPLDPDLSSALFRLYDAGEYGEFDRRLSSIARRPINWYELEADADAWVAAASPERGRLVAAAVALEFALREPSGSPWTPLFVELGCRVLRERPAVPLEGAWQRAVVALARSGPVVLSRPVSVDEALQATNAARVRPPQEQDPRRAEFREVVQSARRTARRVSPRSTLDDVSPWGEHAAHLLGRFPNDPHLLLLRALTIERSVSERVDETLLITSRSPVAVDASVVAELVMAGRGRILAMPPNQRLDRASAELVLRTWPELNQGYVGQPLGTHPARRSWLLWAVADEFRALADRPGVAAEANLRLAQTYVRLGRREDALLAFARAEAAATTPYERYLAKLLGGIVLESLGRRVDAMSVLRGALDVAPRTQSAVFALAPMLYAFGARDEAADLLTAAVQSPPPDPLQFYWTGDPAERGRVFADLRRALQQR